MKTTTEMSGCTGTRIAAVRPPASVQAMVKPPSTAGATLSGWPSISVASRITQSVPAAADSAGASAPASRIPATIAAADEPRPLPWGMVFLQVSRMPGGSTPRSANARWAAWTTRWEASLGTSSAQIPDTSISRPDGIRSATTSS